MKVHIHCYGCKQKVKKILGKIDGVFTIKIDAEQGMVTVSGSVDPATLVAKIQKAGKHAELLAPKGGNNNHNISQFQKPQHENDKGHKMSNGGVPPKAQQKAMPLHQLKQMKGFSDVKDMKSPCPKDPRTVKFSLPLERRDEVNDFDDFNDDDDDDDDEELDDLDCFDADFEVDFKTQKIKPMKVPSKGNWMMPGKNGDRGGAVNGKKGGPGDVYKPPTHGMGGANAVKNCSGGVKKGGPVENKNAGKTNYMPAPGGSGDANAGKSIINGGHGNKKVGGNYNDVGGEHPMSNPNMRGQEFHVIDVGRMGKVQAPMGRMGNIPAVGSMPPGYKLGGMVPQRPEVIAASAATNPYQQQYMAAMRQQQQQRMMMTANGPDIAFHPMMIGYPRPPYAAGAVPVQYVPTMPPPGEPYTNLFSDENTSSCNIM